MPPLSDTVSGEFQLPDSLFSQIPSIAYTVPDFETLATIELFDATDGSVQACIQATLSNGHSLYQKPAVWSTAGLAIFAGLTSLLHTSIAASAGAAQWRIVDVMLTLQQVAITGMLSLDFPALVPQFTKNLAWSVGLLDIKPVQRSISSVRSKTGGDYGNGTFGPDLTALYERRQNLTTPADVQPFLSLNLNTLVSNDIPGVPSIVSDLITVVAQLAQSVPGLESYLVSIGLTTQLAELINSVGYPSSTLNGALTTLSNNPQTKDILGSATGAVVDALRSLGGDPNVSTNLSNVTSDPAVAAAISALQNSNVTGGGGSVNIDGLSGILGGLGNSLRRRDDPSMMLEGSLQRRLTIVSPSSIGASNTTLPTVLRNDTESLRGMQVYVENRNINANNAFLTSLISIAMLLAVILAICLAVYAIAALVRLITVRGTRRALNSPESASRQHRAGRWAKRFLKPSEFLGIFLPAIILRFLLVILQPFIIFAFWQWLAGDTWVGTLLAAVILAIFLLVIVAWSIPMIIHARRAGTPDVLYIDPATTPTDMPASKVARRWGILAHPYRPKYYYFALMLVVYFILRAVFVSFAQDNGLAQIIGLLIIEVIAFLGICILRPGRDKKSDAVSIILSLFRIAAMAICFVFSSVSHVAPLIRVIIGFVLVAALGIPVVIVFLMTVWDLFSPLVKPSFWRKTRMNKSGKYDSDSSSGGTFGAHSDAPMMVEHRH